MTDRYVIHRDRRRGVWVVQRHGDHPRHIADFPTLLEAEQWVIDWYDELDRLRAIAERLGVAA